MVVVPRMVSCRAWCCAVHGVAGAIIVPCWCCGHGHRAARGVAGAIVVLRWCRSCGCCTAWVSPSPFLCHVWYRSRRFCAACGVVVAVVAPCVVSRSWLLCRVGFAVAAVVPRGCRHCHLCAVWVLPSLSLCHVGVAVAVFVPHVVLRSRSLRRMWFRGRSCCAAWLSPSLSLHRMWFC